MRIAPGKHVARIGHLHDCVAYGPGILELAHQPDEYIDIDDMVASAKIMAAAALDLLNEVSAEVTTEELSELNKRFGLDAEDADTLAREWLEDNGF